MGSKQGKVTCASNGGCLLIDSFEGALSDFADETVVDAYDTKKMAVREVIDRVHYLSNCHKGLIPKEDVPPFPSDEDVVASLMENMKLKYVSGDGCRYKWQIVPYSCR